MFAKDRSSQVVLDLVSRSQSETSADAPLAKLAAESRATVLEPTCPTPALLIFLSVLFGAFALLDLWAAYVLNRGTVVTTCLDPYGASYEEITASQAEWVIARLLLVSAALCGLFSYGAWYVERWTRRAATYATVAGILLVIVVASCGVSSGPGGVRLIICIGTLAFLYSSFGTALLAQTKRSKSEYGRSSPKR
jgi:hypothetical protein